MSIVLNSAGGGSVTISEPNTASNRTLTLPDNTGNLISSADSGTVSQTMLASGVAGTGPAFSAYRSTDQGVTSNVVTKLQINTENFDTANCYDNTTNYRFTPNVAGYYQFSFGGYGKSSSSSVMELLEVQIYKNGSALTAPLSQMASYTYTPLNPFTDGATSSSILLYMNGTTDYVEVYGRIVGGGTLNFGQSSFQGVLVRAA